ncbi:MAG: DNA-binding protein WhiA [Clostridiales bacterium]|jgi:DNA-binding protein WhiA|nr:DNA-binding protein WhiA [Clostridiales bacterium]
MTFSAKTKAELCKIPIDDGACALAELGGMILFSNTVSYRELRLTTENGNVANRASRLLRALFGFDFDRKVIPGTKLKKYSFVIDNKEKLDRVFEALGLNPGKALFLRLNGALVEEDETRAAFVRGAFLTGGTVLEPDTGYHLELVTSRFTLSREAVALLLELELPARLAVRKSNNIIYFKESTLIEELLTRIGAPLSAMAIMEAKMWRELRNTVNRKVNCETANLEKTATAAAIQLDAINKIAENRGLDTLPRGLRIAAEARISHPEATLSELADIIGGGITKSGLNHRFRKILCLAGELSNGKKDGALRYD